MQERRSEIDALLRKLAESGMPYVDYVKKYGEPMQDRIKELAIEHLRQTPNGHLGDDFEVIAFAQAIARECAEIAAQTTEYGALDAHGETKAYATEAAIRARFGIAKE